MSQNRQAAHEGLVSSRRPDTRSRARRMRLTALLVMAAIGFSSGVLLQFHDRANVSAWPDETSAPAGPLAYFPR